MLVYFEKVIYSVFLYSDLNIKYGQRADILDPPAVHLAASAASTTVSEW